MTDDSKEPVRDILFISKATPGDDEFVLWLAPRLEAAGYKVFADVKTLEPGDRWRKEITNTLHDRAIKMLLCCRDSTLARDGVQEEIGIALDLSKKLQDSRFIIPLRIEHFKKVFGIGELQHIDFVRGWATGLTKLLDALRRQRVRRDKSSIQIDPQWEIFRRQGALPLLNEPERLTANWLRVIETPDTIRYFEPTGFADSVGMWSAARQSQCIAEPFNKGFLSFATASEINDELQTVGRFEIKHEAPFMTYLDEGLAEYELKKQDASNMAMSMFRKAWNLLCRERGFLEHSYSNAIGFHAGKDQLKIGHKVPWGKQGERRSAMLRNIAKGHVWQFGISGLPAFWPYPHIKLKSRVLFSPINADEAGIPYEDARKQHRLRRSVCKGWRNKQWRSRLMAFLEILSRDLSYIALPLSASMRLTIEAAPLLFSSPVSTRLPNKLEDDEEEVDETTLGRPDPEEEA